MKNEKDIMIKRVNNYWVDKNNNKWNSLFFTKEEAIVCSGSLISCHDCHDCRDCRDCRNCYYCSNCWGCWGCKGCMNCHDYKTNPIQYVTPKIGSRNENTRFYYDRKTLQVVCGCFRGNLKEFEEAVLKTHANNEEYKSQYLKEIEKVKALFELKEDFKHE